MLLCLSLPACGKKGPPLTPIVRVPVAVASVAARRVGDEVFVSLAVPDENLDGSMPASVARIEVYGATAMTPPPRARFLDIATLVATVPVAPAADPEDPRAPVPVPVGTDPGAPQGATVTVRDALSGDELIPRELPRLEEPRRDPPLVVAPSGVNAPLLRRFYMAIPFSDRGRPGPPSAVVELPLAVVVEKPQALRGTITASAVTLAWEPAGGLLAWLVEGGLPVEAPPFAELAIPVPEAAANVSILPTGPTTYNVYRYLAGDPLALPAPDAAQSPWSAEPLAPLNPAPLATLTYSDPVVTDERQRCYRVSAVRGTGAQRVESEPSEPVCATPYDVTPPLRPTGLTAIVGEASITLLWERNVEDDLGGYIVLRGEPGGDTLLSLTAAPIQETRFTDSAVKPGVRYTYYVRAVDGRLPLPNVSDAAQLSETAR